MPAEPHNNISWYANVYYSYRDYPIKQLNVKYKKSELKTIYNTLIKKMFNNFDISVTSQDSSTPDDPSYHKKPLQDLIQNVNHQQTSSERTSQKSAQQPLSSASSRLSILSNNIQPQNSNQSIFNASQTSQTEEKARKPSIQSPSQSSIPSAESIQKSRQKIQPMRESANTLNQLNQLHIFQMCSQTQVKNMDVLYELMIGMIRLTMKRITVEIDQEIKLAKQNDKKFEIIDQEAQQSSNVTDSDRQSSFKSISHQSSSDVNSEQSLKSKTDLSEENYKFVTSYSASLAEARKKILQQNSQRKAANRDRKQLIDTLDKERLLTNFQYPFNMQQLKFSFLKYSLTTHVTSNPNSNSNSYQRTSSLNQKPKPSFSENSIPEVGSFKEVTEESEEHEEAEHAKGHLNTFCTQFTQIDEQKTLKSSPKDCISEMQSLVMKVANFQMKSFNLFVNHFFKKIQQASTIVNVIGLDAITDSMCQMAMGKQARSNGIKTQVGLGNMQIKLFSNSVSQENSNILLSTWADLVLFAEDPKMLYEITQNLNIESKYEKQAKKKKVWTPSIPSTPICMVDQKDPESQTIMYRQKLLSLLNFLILNTTKNIFLESVTKANFLSLVMIEMLANRQDRRGLREYELRSLRDSEMVKEKKSSHFLCQDQAIIIYDLTFKKEVWIKESLDFIFSKWKKVIEIIFEEQIKNGNLYWELVFEKCVTYVNKQLSLLTVLVFSLVEIMQNLNLHIKFIIENEKMGEWTKQQIQKHEYMKSCLEMMIKEVVGCPKVFGFDETETMGCQINSFSKSFNKNDITNFQEHGFKFLNREQNAKELSMWEAITKENILILENYIRNVELIARIFEQRPLHTAWWVVNFHQEAKMMIKNVKNENLSLFFQKFYVRIPQLWQNLNAEQQQDKLMPLQTKRVRGQHARQRISSIKQKRQLSSLQKQALIINYMIKAELELYESYTKSHVLNCRQESSTMTTIVSGSSTLKHNRPFIFDEASIEALLLFSLKCSSKSQKGVISNNLFAKRNQKVNLTVKPLSSFVPSANLYSLSPRKSPGKQKLEPFKKQAKGDFGKSTSKQLQRLQVNGYEIDVSLLQMIQYTKEQIQFLKQLSNHLKFINQINFQYEFYYWKNVSYLKKINFKPRDHQIETSANQQQFTQANTQDNPHGPKITSQLKKMLTYNEYAKEKTQKLLTTQELLHELASINKTLPGSRSSFIDTPIKFDNEIDQQIRLSTEKNLDLDEKDNAKNLYKQKMQEFHERIMIHNESLLLIVKAALEAKNYWKAVSMNVFPDEEMPSEQKQEYMIKIQSKLQKVSEQDLQIDFQERFFEKKILQKLEEYIIYYREISEQMNYCIDSGKIDAEEVEDIDVEAHGGVPIQGVMRESDFRSIQKQGKGDRSVKNNRSMINGEKREKLCMRGEREESGEQEEKRDREKLSILKKMEETKSSKVRVYSLLQSLIFKKQQPKMNRFQIAASIYQFSQKILRINCYMSSFYVERKIYLDIISNQQLSEQKHTKVKIIGKKYFQKIKELSVDIYEDKQIREENLRNVELIYEKKVLLIMVSLMELIYYGNEHTKTIVGKWKESSDLKSKKDRMKTMRELNANSKFTTVYEINDKEFERGYKNHGFKVRKHTLRKYSETLKKYLKFRLKKNTGQILQKEGLSEAYLSSSGDQQAKSDYFHMSKLLSEVFEFGEVTEDFSEEKLIQTLRKLRTQQTDEEFLKFYMQIMQKQTEYLEEFEGESQKVNCLKKKFNYLILREVYFFLYYDIDCLEEKSPHSKKNYELYENRILDFYNQIIAKSYRDFTDKKEMELKKRSVYLQNYLLKYQDQPQLIPVQKNLNKLLVCLFNQILLIYTQHIQIQIKKKSEQVNALNHKILKNPHNPLHTQYLSTQFYQDKTLFRKITQQPSSQHTSHSGSKNLRNNSNFTLNDNNNFNFNPNSNSTNYNHLNQHSESTSRPSINAIHSLFPAQLSQQHQSSRHAINSPSKHKNTQKSSQSLSSNSVIGSQTHTKPLTFKVFSIHSINLHEAIHIYQELRHKNTVAVEKCLTRLKQSLTNTKSLKRDDLTEMEIKTLETNQESIVSLLKREIIQKINQLKFELVQKNLISRIQKLYINLDVRHKVFESFKDKILSYEMQKAKIYHQYMDYIRGLKLDVYAHIANEDSLPYIKILNAIKFYRLQIKKEELENKVRQEFGKNLKKWNQGIQEDIENYNEWLEAEERQWENAKVTVDEQKQKFLLVYDTIKKQLRRQSKKRQLQEKRAVKQNAQMIKNQFQTSVNDLKKAQKPTKELKKVGMSKKNLFMVQKQKLNQLLQSPQSYPKNLMIEDTQTNQIQTNQRPKHFNSKEQQENSTPENMFMKVSVYMKRPTTTHIVKSSSSMHLLNQRSLSKHSSSNKLQRPTTSVHSEVRMLYHTVGLKPKSWEINRASTAVTREKSIDLQASQFRGIKMKYVSKSSQKFMSCGQFVMGEDKNFKRSTDYSAVQGERVNSIYLNEKGRNKTVMPSSLNGNEGQLKSRTLLKQVRVINSAVPDRKGIIKNY